MSESLSEEQLKEVSDAIVAGQKIEAIRIYRELTGLGLKEAKEAVEELQSSLYEAHPELKEAYVAKSGCAGVVIFGFCLLSYGVYEWSMTFL